MLVIPTVQLGVIILKSLPPTGGTICLEACHINSVQTPLNRDDGSLLADAYLHLINENERSLVSV